MKLKQNIDVNDLMQTVKYCKGDVFFHTAQGDILNINSALSQYVLISVLYNRDILKDSIIVCTQDSDYQLLKDFLE